MKGFIGYFQKREVPGVLLPSSSILTQSPNDLDPQSNNIPLGFSPSTRPEGSLLDSLS